MRRGRPDASAERRTENGPAAHQRKNLLKGGPARACLNSRSDRPHPDSGS